MTPSVRIGVLRLADSAPALVADALGLFAGQGIEAEIAIEPSWANIADKLTWGRLDAAIMLPPLALAAAIGLRGPRSRIIVPMGLTQGGNSIVLGHDAAAELLPAPPGEHAMQTGVRLVAWLRRQSTPPRFAVVHVFSGHNLLFRYWLSACGGDPDRDIETVVVPPALVVEALAGGAIAGFCAGAPWGQVAEAERAGKIVLGTSAIWPGHPEKCLAMTQDFAAGPAALGVLRALLQAGAVCDDPARTAEIAALLARLDLPLAASLACLPGGGSAEPIGFHAGGAWVPRRAQAMWFLRQMHRWGWIGSEITLEQAAHDIYRPELVRDAARQEGLAWPADRPDSVDGEMVDGSSLPGPEAGLLVS